MPGRKPILPRSKRPADAAPDAAREQVDAEPAPPSGTPAIFSRMEVRVAAVVVQRYERVEQVDAARQEDRDQHRRIGAAAASAAAASKHTFHGIAFAP